MSKITYLVSNGSEGPVCVAGRERIFIPGLCKDEPVKFPAESASKTVARLKRDYPLLKFREAPQETAEAETKSASKKKGKTQDAAAPDNQKTRGDAGQQSVTEGENGASV